MSKTAQPDGYIPRDRSHHRKESDLAPLDPNFGGCARVITGDDGGSEFRTVQPGPYPWRNGMNDWRPAHIHLQGPQDTIFFDS